MYKIVHRREPDANKRGLLAHVISGLDVADLQDMAAAGEAALMVALRAKLAGEGWRARGNAWKGGGRGAVR